MSGGAREHGSPRQAVYAVLSRESRYTRGRAMESRSHSACNAAPMGPQRVINQTTVKRRPKLSHAAVVGVPLALAPTTEELSQRNGWSRPTTRRRTRNLNRRSASAA